MRFNTLFGLLACECTPSFFPFTKFNQLDVPCFMHHPFYKCYSFPHPMFCTMSACIVLCNFHYCPLWKVPISIFSTISIVPLPYGIFVTCPFSVYKLIRSTPTLVIFVNGKNVLTMSFFKSSNWCLVVLNPTTRTPIYFMCHAHENIRSIHSM